MVPPSQILPRWDSAVDERNTENSADLMEFEQIEATGARLVVADECLRLAESDHVNLQQTSVRPEFT